MTKWKKPLSTTSRVWLSAVRWTRSKGIRGCRSTFTCHQRTWRSTSTLPSWLARMAKWVLSRSFQRTAKWTSRGPYRHGKPTQYLSFWTLMTLRNHRWLTKWTVRSARCGVRCSRTTRTPCPRSMRWWAASLNGTCSNFTTRSSTSQSMSRRESFVSASTRSWISWSRWPSATLRSRWTTYRMRSSVFIIPIAISRALYFISVLWSSDRHLSIQNWTAYRELLTHLSSRHSVQSCGL